MDIELEVGSGTAQPSSDSEPSGIEKRINELTAKARELESKYNQMSVENQTLKEVVSMQRQATMVPPAPSPLEEKLAALPEDQRGLASLVQELVAQAIAPIAGQVQVSQVAKLAAEAGLSAQEMQAAEQLYKDFVRRGLPATAEGAIVSTVGLLNYKTRKEAALTRTARAGQDTSMLGSGNPQPQTQGQQLPPVPADIDDWDADEQWKFWAKRTGRIK